MKYKRAMVSPGVCSNNKLLPHVLTFINLVFRTRTCNVLPFSQRGSEVPSPIYIKNRLRPYIKYISV